MTQVPVTCPDCQRSFVINGRGRCRCGSYLIHHIGKNSWKTIDPTDDRPIWDLSGDVPRRIHPIEEPAPPPLVERDPVDQAIADRHPDIPQDSLPVTEEATP